MKATCKRVDVRKSAIARKSGSGRPKIIRADDNNIELFCAVNVLLFFG